MKCFLILYLFVSLEYLLGFCTAWVNEEYDEECRTPDNEDGVCIKLTDCKYLFDYVKRLPGVNKEMINFLTSYTCGYEKNDVKICCPTSKISEPRIVNGRNAELFEFPWMALLLYSGTSVPYQCGGSLISDRYVLTAAHCIHTRKIKLIGVRLGEYNLNTEIDCDVRSPTHCAEPVQAFDVSLNDVIVHPNYDHRSLANDIALIRLRRAANTSVESVKPIYLPLPGDIYTNSNYIVTGWGLTETGVRSSTLRKASLNLSPSEQCMASYRNFRSYMHNENQLCTNGGVKKQNSCSGDSGGPLMRRVIQNNMKRMTQFGIVSFGISGCQLDIRHDFPSVFTKVAPYVDWILETLQS